MSFFWCLYSAYTALYTGDCRRWTLHHGYNCALAVSALDSGLLFDVVLVQFLLVFIVVLIGIASCLFFFYVTAAELEKACGYKCWPEGRGDGVEWSRGVDRMQRGPRGNRRRELGRGRERERMRVDRRRHRRRRWRPIDQELVPPGCSGRQAETERRDRH